MERLMGFAGEEMVVLFAILALGTWLGSLTWRGSALGTAGVFFVALGFGHAGFRTPKPIMELGLLLFVYAVGLTAGPRFFRTFRRQGLQFVVVGLATVAAGALVALAVTHFLGLPYDMAAGLFCGAMTNTPALAAAIDAVGRFEPGHSQDVAAGYGVAYPFSMLALVLLVQFLPRLFRRDLRAEEAEWRAAQQQESPALQVKQFVVTNPNCVGRSLAEINPHRLSVANVSRIRSDDKDVPASGAVVLRLGDIVSAVGSSDELDKLRLIFGEETSVPRDVNTHVVVQDLEMTAHDLAGRPLAELRLLERYGVVITRVRRQGLEIAPTGMTSLEMGDTVRVVGDQAALGPFAQVIGGDHRKADETNMVPFLVGLLLGVTLGNVHFDVGAGLSVKLGGAGGAFIVSLLAGHFGGLGPFRFWVPPAARNLSRELGLMLFMSGAGTNAGSCIVSVLRTHGWQLVLGGMAVTFAAVSVSLLMTMRLYRMSTLATMGSLAAYMTNPPALSAANAQSETEVPTVAYASAYPVALIFKIIVAQLLVEFLRAPGT